MVHSNGEEPSSLDPALSIGGGSDAVVAALLDSLIGFSPLTHQPAAALATHYTVNSQGTQYTFFLRGHPMPGGIRLPNTDSLPWEFSRGRKAPPDRTPARWSDGTPVTAHDFVYSWRRIVDPQTAAPIGGFYLACLGNAEDIIKGAKPPNTLAIRALDEFTFQVELTAPTPSFLRVLWQSSLAAAPRQSIEAARRRGRESSWTMPGTYVSSGPFLLREWKAHDRVVLTRNPYYWEAQCVAIEEIVFLPISNGTTNVNLYKAGAMQSMNPWLIPPLLVPALKKKRDFGTSPAFRSLWYSLDTSKPPLDRLRVRYALNLGYGQGGDCKLPCRGPEGSQRRGSSAAWLSFARSIAGPRARSDVEHPRIRPPHSTRTAGERGNFDLRTMGDYPSAAQKQRHCTDSSAAVARASRGAAESRRGGRDGLGTKLDPETIPPCHRRELDSVLRRSERFPWPFPAFTRRKLLDRYEVRSRLYCGQPAP